MIFLHIYYRVTLLVEDQALEVERLGVIGVAFEQAADVFERCVIAL